MIKKFQKTDGGRVNIRGTIAVGCKGIKTNCPACKKDIWAWKLGESNHICPLCRKPVAVSQGAQERPAALPFFLVPAEVKEVFGEYPTALTAIPAYQALDRTIPNDYARFVKSSRLPVCVGDGVSAKERIQEEGKYTEKTRDIACSETCKHRTAKPPQCKPSGRFRFFIPEIDALSAYELKVGSEISICNIIETLQLMTGSDGKIARQPCTLRLKQGTSSPENGGREFSFVELLPPKVPLAALGGGDSAPRIGYDSPPQGIDVPAAVNNDPKSANGRKMIVTKLTEIIQHPLFDKAFVAYVAAEYGRSFEELSYDELLVLFKSITPDAPIVKEISELCEDLTPVEA